MNGLLAATNTLLLVVFIASGCATQNLSVPRPQVDLSPVGCGYKWFQSGHSPDRLIDCSVDRSELHAQEKQLAVADAWRIARNRCPSACPPIELPDAVPAPDRPPEGRCQQDVVYYVTRVFFQCSDN